MDLTLARLSRFAGLQGSRAYVVGGYIRDKLLAKPVADIDIAAPADPFELAQQLAQSWGGSFVPLDEANRIARVVLPSENGLTIDFTALEGSIEADLAERDFTVDAMSIDLETAATEWGTEAVIDPFGGRQDLKDKVIRAISPQAFEHDPARLLRAVRLAAEYGFTIEPTTESVIQRDSALISNVAGERLREELCQMLSVPGAANHLRYLDQLGLLTRVMPEMETTKGVTQPVEHYWDVFQHSLETVVAVELLLRAGATVTSQQQEILSAVPWSEALAQHFQQELSPGVSRIELLKLAALLHDIAKPQTKSQDEKGRTHFLGHTQEGELITISILERLRFSNRQKKMVASLVLYHMRPGQMSDIGLPSHRALYRYFRDTAEVAIDTLFLGLADHLATKGPRLDMFYWREHCQLVDFVLSQYFEQQQVVKPVKLLDGHDLMAVFDLKPGPGIGELLEMVREAQAADEIHTREEALSLVRQRLALAVPEPSRN